jgi:hypothetical protein
MIRNSCHRMIPDGWSATLTLPDYGRVARDSGGIANDDLERGYAQHDSKLLELKVDPRMDNLRSNPRFQDLLRRMNFPA